MKKVAILYICTGKYSIFWEDFFESAEKKLFKNSHVEYFVFTDVEIKPLNDRVTIVECEHLGWPFATLMRFHLFKEIKSELETFDYLFFMNANLVILEEVSEEVLPIEEELLAVIHPGFYNRGRETFTYERNTESSACMNAADGEHYFMGAFNGGKAKAFLQLSEALALNIDTDLKKGIVALWHDESHLNKYFWRNRSKLKILNPSYLYPEGWNLPFEKKILVRDKTNYGGHLFLRSKN